MHDLHTSFSIKGSRKQEVIRASCTYSFYGGGANLSLFSLFGHQFPRYGTISNLLHLNMKLGHWKKLQKLYIHVQPPSIREGGGGVQNWAYFKLNGQRFPRHRHKTHRHKIALFENDTTTDKSYKSCSLFQPQDSKLSLFLLYGSGYRDTDKFLALLDYVSIAHEIEIRPSSVRRPYVASIISEVIAWISFKFWLWLPLGHMPRRSNFLRICFLFVNMGPYGSENFKTILLLQIAAESFQTFPAFSS